MERLGALAREGASVCFSVEPTAEGVLSATGLVYLAHGDHGQVRFVRADCAQAALGETFFEAPVLGPLAKRVYRGFANRISHGCPRARGGRCAPSCAGSCARRVHTIAAADDEGMPEALHAYLVQGFRLGREVRGLAARDPRIALADELHTSVVNECEKARQFVRFSELSSGAFFALYTPKANVIPLVAAHFVRRMEGERFLLADPEHAMAALYQGGRLVVGALSAEEVAELSRPHELSAVEGSVRALWKRFYDALALPGRGRLERGYDLRATFMPKRIAEGLVELDPTADEGWRRDAWSEVVEAEAAIHEKGAPGIAGSARRSLKSGSGG